MMKLIFSGKTKDVYSLPDGRYLLKFKDDATGKDGVFDPGANEVGLTIDGLGRESLALSKYFFTKLNDANIPNHFVSADLDEAEMTVKPVKIFGGGLEVIVRFRAVGSFFRRYKDHVKESATLDALVEFTLKNDDLGDPPITQDALAALNIMTIAQSEECKKLAQKVGRFIKDDLSKKGLELYDIKFEFGEADGRVLLADEISGGCMRVYRDGAWVQPMDLNALVLR